MCICWNTKWLSCICSRKSVTSKFPSLLEIFGYVRSKKTWCYRSNAFFQEILTFHADNSQTLPRTDSIRSSNFRPRLSQNYFFKWRLLRSLRFRSRQFEERLLSLNWACSNHRQSVEEFDDVSFKYDWNEMHGFWILMSWFTSCFRKSKFDVELNVFIVKAVGSFRRTGKSRSLWSQGPNCATEIKPARANSNPRFYSLETTRVRNNKTGSNQIE